MSYEAKASSEAEAAFVRAGIAANVRADGREREDVRAVALETGVLAAAAGSARARLGGGDVLVSVKAELVEPLATAPKCGRIAVSVAIPGAAAGGPEAGRAGDDAAAALAAALEAALVGGADGSGGAVDLEQLCVVPGRTVWGLYVDGVVLAADGSLLDALAVATKAALADVRVPKVEAVGGADGEDPELEVDDDPASSWRLDTRACPLVVSLTKVGRLYVADASADEEAHCDATLAVAVRPNGDVAGVTKHGDAALDLGTVREMVIVATRVAKELHAAVDSFLLTQGGL